MRRRLVLFDIDGTLITDGGAAREAFAESLIAVYGYAGDVNRYDFSGRTDPQIAYMVLRDEGLHDREIERGFPELWRRYLIALERNANAPRIHALPGIGPLLERLRSMPHLILALLTGNIEPGARLKLGPPELNEYFPFGAFGSDSQERENLPPIAVERASRRGGHRFEGEDVVIIGDSIYDVRCGVPYGATTIAIASGKTSADALRAEGPSHFFASAEELEGIVAAIIG